jgi:hypothetical protein
VADDQAMSPMSSVSFPGPFSHHDVVNDWRVPFMTSHLVREGRVTVVLHRRLGIELSTDEAERLLPFVADAIAVALGYGAHPGRGGSALWLAVRTRARNGSTRSSPPPAGTLGLLVEARQIEQVVLGRGSREWS